MSKASLALESDSFFQSFWERILGELPAAAEEWSRRVNELNSWEVQNLFTVERPSPDALARHRKIVDRLMFLGQLFAFITTHPEFPDRDTAEMVFATQYQLREKLEAFHHPMAEDQAEQVLKEVFPEP